METSSSNRSTFLLAKFSIHLALFVVFLVFFGIPSWKRCFYWTELYIFWTIRAISLWTYHFSKWPRYNAKGVLTKTEQTSMENLKLPAVTICPRFSTQEFSTQYTSTMTPCQTRGRDASGWREGDPSSKFWDVVQHQCRWSTDHWILSVSTPVQVDQYQASYQ